jgi:hypothetical protein
MQLYIENRSDIQEHLMIKKNFGFLKLESDSSRTCCCSSLLANAMGKDSISEVGEP